MKTEYFQNKDVNDANDNKMLWKTVKSRLSNKCKTGITVILIEWDLIMKNKKLIAETFNNYNADITKNSKMERNMQILMVSLYLVLLII